LRISHIFYRSNRFCDRSELSSQYRTQATRWCIYGIVLCCILAGGSRP